MPIKTDAIISHMKDEFDYDAREEKRAIRTLFMEEMTTMKKNIPGAYIHMAKIVLFLQKTHLI